MNKSREHIKQFLSFYRPASDQDDDLIGIYYNKRKIKVISDAEDPDSKNTDTITFRQFEHWLYTKMPSPGNVIKFEETGCIGIVTKERWDSFIVGAFLCPDGTMTFGEFSYSDEAYVLATDIERTLFQQALSVNGCSWSYISGKLEQRMTPTSPQFIRLMFLGEQVGVGVFKEILPDGTLEMFCVKMGKEGIQFEGMINLGDADYYSFAKTYDEHRALIQSELAAHGYIWNARCQRIEKNNARAKLGKNYYSISNILKIKPYTEKNTTYDQDRFNKGNYFLSRAVAERARDRILNICKEEMLSEDNC